MKLITNVNPKRTPINWEDFLMLCRSAGLVSGELYSKQRLNFYKDGVEVLREVQKSSDGKLKSSGWFSPKCSEDDHWHGHELTDGGQVCILETINPFLPMEPESQQAFTFVLNYIYTVRLDLSK